MDKDEEIYRLLVNEVADYAIYMLDQTGIVMTWNLGAERLKGYKAAEIIGTHFSRFYLPNDVAAGKPERQLRSALANGRVEHEGWHVRKDGSVFWANVVLTAVYDSQGEHRGFGKIICDLTKRRQHEMQLQQSRADLERRVRERTVELAEANNELAEANHMKDEFLATLSHELRTPLTAAFGWIQLMLAGGMDEIQRRKGLEVVDRNLRAQIRLVDDLLNVSNIVAGKIGLDLREANAVEIVRTAVDSVRPAAREKGIDLSFPSARVAGSIRAVVDPARLQQIAWNLLANALKFTPTGGRVQVTLERSADLFVLGVSDNGEGIAPEFLPHVFEPFRQADSSAVRKHGGLGIGLSLVRHLAELHGGTVMVASPGKGKGATFRVSLPLRRAASGARSDLPRPA
jgi:PAS domain S-box-containing protein